MLNVNGVKQIEVIRAEGDRQLCNTLFYYIFRCCTSLKMELDMFTLKCRKILDFNIGKRIFLTFDVIWTLETEV